MGTTLERELAKYTSVEQARRVLGVAVQTVLDWADSGKLCSVREPFPPFRRLLLRADVMRVARERKKQRAAQAADVS